MNFKQNIIAANISMYDIIDPLDANLYIPTQELQKLIASHIIGKSLSGLPLRTRSKVVKTLICEALGYKIPKSFKKTQPRFLGQNFDVYTQKSLNVQIWNEDIDPNRRYVFIQIDETDTITAVKIINGQELVKYDRTGTLTQKYQATMIHKNEDYCSDNDTDRLCTWMCHNNKTILTGNPNSTPTADNLLEITEIFNRLHSLIGKEIHYLNATQERNRGAGLHEMICKNLGYTNYEDDGSYPDIKNQLLEIKLQTSPTIDLGLHSPDDGKLILTANGQPFYSEDIRYVIFDAEVIGDIVRLNKLYVVSGKEFSRVFPLFKGKGINSKIQLPLPSNFFTC